MADLSLAFDILARDKASRVLDDVGGKADSLGSKLGGIAGSAKLLAGGAAVGGVAALGSAFVQGVKDAASYEKLQAKTTAVIESTGNAANISVEGVQNLAGSLESISGVDEEEIINSQNVLATFTKIKNAGPDKVFDDAAKAALESFRTAPEELSCPECGNTIDGEGFSYVEDISNTRSVNSYEDGTLEIEGYYETCDGDGNGTNPRLFCNHCSHEWPIKDAIGTEFV